MGIRMVYYLCCLQIRAVSWNIQSVGLYILGKAFQRRLKSLVPRFRLVRLAIWLAVSAAQHDTVPRGGGAAARLANDVIRHIPGLSSIMLRYGNMYGIAKSAPMIPRMSDIAKARWTRHLCVPLKWGYGRDEELSDGSSIRRVTPRGVIWR